MIIAFLGQPLSLLVGLISGFCVGFLLEKARLADFNVIVGQFLLRNFRMMKVLMVAIVAVSVLLYGFSALGYMQVPANTISPIRAIIGGAILGAGMAILGYCPASALAAVGQGARDALWGLLGMVTGGVLVATIFPLIVGYFPSKEVPTFLFSYWGVSPWALVAILALGSGGLLGILEGIGK